MPAQAPCCNKENFIDFHREMPSLRPMQVKCAVSLRLSPLGSPPRTLNTIHYAGVSSKNITLGVPRLHGVIAVAANIKTPPLTVYLDPFSASNNQSAKVFHAELARTTLRTVTAKTEILYDPIPNMMVIEEDKG
jgi:DNA-directed RNA polymerase II subunit RPB1